MYRHGFERINNTGFPCKVQGKCLPESCLNTFSKIFDFEKNVRFHAGSNHRHVETQTDRQCLMLGKNAQHTLTQCHPKLVSGSCHQYIMTSSENIKNITSTSLTAKRKVRGDLVLRKAAFTLAEVLITLGVIGVVAALTMPGLIAKYRREVLKAEFNKTYNELQQINLSFIKDTGYNICEYNWMLVDSGEAVQTAAASTTEKVVAYYKGKGDELHNKFNNDVKTVSGGTANKYRFDDGNMWNFLRKTFYSEYGKSPNKCMVITVDINGYYEKPNQLGVDMFSFRPTKDGRVIPLGNPNMAKNGANGSQDFTDCSMKTNSGENISMGCAYWASINVNPDDNTKDYWNDFIKY